MAPVSSGVEPPWLVNRRTNTAQSLIFRLPNEIIMSIMRVLAMHNRPGIYMIRQVCHLFAKLFGAPCFRGLHELDDSIILSREKRNVDLDTLPLKAFRWRFIFVAFSPYSLDARNILARDFKNEASRLASESDNEEKPSTSIDEQSELLCHFCFRKHSVGDFRPLERKPDKCHSRLCERWYGFHNVCAHCDMGKMDFNDHGMDTQKLGYYERSTDYEDKDFYRCRQCFGDLVPPEIDILERFPDTKFPACKYSRCIHHRCHMEDMYRSWRMPLFTNMNAKPEPKDITRQLMRERLWALSEGPCEDLLRLSIGPLASFRDNMFLEAFGEDGIQNQNWYRSVDIPKTEDGWVHFDDDGEWGLGWSLRNGDLYLCFEHHFWAYCEFFIRVDRYNYESKLYSEMNPRSDSEEEQEEY